MARFSIQLELTDEEHDKFITWLGIKISKRNAVSGDNTEWVEINPILDQIKRQLQGVDK